MGICYYCFWFLVFIRLSIVVDSSFSSEESKMNARGPVISVNKHIFFPDFRLHTNSRLLHDLKLLGSAKLSNENGVVQIPDESQAIDLRHQAGRALYSSPVRLLDPVTQAPASFETTFSFQFSSTNTGRDGGSGLSFIIVPDEFTVGRAGPWLGMLNDACNDDYKAVAVEFDTRHNPEFGDPNDNHVGINLGSIVSTRAVNASDVGIFLKDGSVHRAWIAYNGIRRWMDVRLGSEGHDYPSKPIFSGALDISPFLNEYMFVGFSASTGNMTQIHNLLSWNFSSTSQASLRFPSKETCEQKIMLQQNAGSAQQKYSHSDSSEPPHGFLIFIAVAVLALVIFLTMYFISRRRQRKDIALSEKKQRPRPPNKPRRFTLAEISAATRAFSELEVLGSDYRGVYYRGLLNGSQVAVKRFSAQFLSSPQGPDKRRLLKEIGSISRVRHPNLVPIRGWSCDNRQTMVVYEFYPNGSLDKWLFGVGVLPWSRRLKVVKDVAEALSFLHSKGLAHKNMKTTSVFLDVSFRALLGDYGFVVSANESRRFEAATSQKADVFEFGVFVLEVVSGRRRLEGEMSSEEVKDLLEFAWRMHECDDKVKVVDGRMGSLVNMEQAVKVIEIGLLCTLNETKGRPCMEELVEFLNLKTNLPELPQNRPVALFPYNSNTGLCTGYSCAPFK